MNTQTLSQLKAKHRAALACIELFENATDASMKNTASEWYESFVDDINELRVPEEEKAQYFDLQPASLCLSDAYDYAIAEEQERSRPRNRYHLALHENVSVAL
jgi:hypothetical protein